MNKKRKYIDVSGFTAAILLFVGLFVSTASAQMTPQQSVVGDPAFVLAPAGNSGNIAANYHVSNNDNTLTGVGVKVFWDSTKLSSFSLTNVFATNKLSEDASCQADGSNDDGDAATNCFMLVAWLDVSGTWPNTPLPQKLYDVTFTSNVPVNTSTLVHFVVSSPASGYVGTHTTVTVSGGGPGLNVTPSSANFGSLNVGSNTSLTFTLSSTGDVPVSVTGLSFSGANGGDFSRVSGGNCASSYPFSIPNGSNCTLVVQFAPGAAGARNANMDVYNNSATNPVAVALSGNGTVPDITSDGPLNIGNVAVGSTGTGLITITNAGDGPLSISTVTIGAGPFSIASTTCANATLNQNGTCAINVNFSPVAQGAANTTVTVNSDDPDTPALGINVTGNGTQATLDLDTHNINFGQVQVGSTSAAQTVTVTNNGNITLNLTGWPASGTGYAVVAGAPTTCTGTLAANASCVIGVTFSPNNPPRTQTGLLTVQSSNGTPLTDTVNLTGEGIASSVAISGNLAFGDVRVNTASAAHTITITNAGGAVLNVTTVSSDNAQFAISNNTCNGAAVPANGGTCTLDVVFTPTSTGNQSATLSVASDAATSPDQATLTGRGVQAYISMTPDPLTFGNVMVGDTPTANITISNPGSMDLTFLGPLTFAGDAPFSLLSDTCDDFNGGLLAANASCTATIRFAPTGVGAFTATLDANTDAAPNNGQQTPDQHVDITGSGIVQPLIQLNGLLGFGGDFGTIVIGQTGTGTVLLTNTGNDILNLVQMIVDNDPPFSITGGSCVGTTSLDPNESCTIDLQFAPNAAGNFTGNLIIDSNAANNPHLVFALAGRAVNIAAVPTLSAWGLLLMSIMLGLIGFARSRRKHH